LLYEVRKYVVEKTKLLAVYPLISSQTFLSQEMVMGDGRGEIYQDGVARRSEGDLES